MKADWRAADLTLPSFRPSFTRHIYPILSAVAGMWRIHRRAGADTNYHAVLDPAGFADLGGPASDPALRDDIFRRIRDPKKLLKAASPPEPRLMPLTLGDYYGPANGRGGNTDPAFFHSVSLLQYELLRAWKDGRFDADWTGIPDAASAPITPHGLDRAALENAVGGGFFPGIEASWLFTQAQCYRAPFRVARGKTVGRVAVPQATGGGAASRGLVLEAGAFTQQMAVPWQADFMECKTEPHSFDGVTRKTAWWPVQRPDDAFPAASPNARVPWARKDDGGALSGKEQMVALWSSLGFIVEANGKLVEVDGPAPPSA
jgi:hypothetical protein